MDLVPIKQSKMKKNNVEIDIFVVPAISMNKPDGTVKKVPHPYGNDSIVFKHLDKAIKAIDLAGFGYNFEDKKVPASDIPTAISTDLTDALEPLLDMLQDEKSAVVASAAFALGELRSTDAIKPLIQILGLDDQLIRTNAIGALAKIGDAAVKCLIETLEDNNWVARNSAVIALGEMINHSPNKILYAIPSLIKRLKDSNWIVRSSAANSIGKISAYIRENY